MEKHSCLSECYNLYKCVLLKAIFFFFRSFPLIHFQVGIKRRLIFKHYTFLSLTHEYFLLSPCPSPCPPFIQSDFFYSDFHLTVIESRRRADNGGVEAISFSFFFFFFVEKVKTTPRYTVFTSHANIQELEFGNQLFLK